MSNVTVNCSSKILEAALSASEATQFASRSSVLNAALLLFEAASEEDRIRAMKKAKSFKKKPGRHSKSRAKEILGIVDS